MKLQDLTFIITANPSNPLIPKEGCEIKSSHFKWHWYGSNKTIVHWKSKNATISIVYDTVDNTVYHAEVYGSEEHSPYRYIPAEFKDAYLSECDTLNLNSKTAPNNLPWVDLEVEEDLVEKANALFNGLPYDTRVQVFLNLTDEEFMNLAADAHRKDITLNQLIADIIEYYINLGKNRDE